MDHCKVYLFLTSINIVFTDKYFKLLHEHLTCVCVCAHGHSGHLPKAHSLSIS